MTMQQSTVGCGGCPMHRRRFLAAGCAACVGASSLPLRPAPLQAAEDQRPLVRIVFALHADVQPGPDWPNVGFDFRPVMDEVEAKLKSNCPSVRFVSAKATGPEQAAKILEVDADSNVDGYIVVQLNCWNRVVQSLVETKKPVLYVDFPYAGSGGFLVYTANLMQRFKNFGFVSSSDWNDVAAAAKCFGDLPTTGAEGFGAAVATVRCARTRAAGDMSCAEDPLQLLSVSDWQQEMKKAKILVVGRRMNGKDEAIRQTLGIEVVEVPYSVINEAWAAADKATAAEVADRWQKGAARIEGVERSELENSAAMYLGMKSVLAEQGATGISVNCLGGFYGGHIHAYPCLGFHQLCNEGLVGGCEADVRSAITMTALTTLTRGRTGFISDPVIDTAKRQIIYAHCVASNRALGPQGQANDYEILTHSEDRKGAAVRSLLPSGYMTTTVEFEPTWKKILFHQAKAVDNDLNDRACRTKLAAEPVGDFEKLFTQWTPWGWHRVTAYGDLKDPIYELATAIGWTVVEEA